jgi:hypothetical protein
MSSSAALMMAPRARAVRLGDQAGQAAHQRDRHLPGLALDQVGG